MTFLELRDICEQHMELINPFTEEKILRVGEVLGLKPGQKVIEFGCGYGEVLKLWALEFGIHGVGMDIRENCVKRARAKMEANGLADRIEIIHGAGAEFPFEKGAYDVAACIGASFCWPGGYPDAIAAMRECIRPGGRVAIGEPYWLHSLIPPEYRMAEGGMVHTECDLARIARESGYDVEYFVRSSHDDWDRYEAGNSYGFVRWLEANPDHPERDQVIAEMRKYQDEYFGYTREFMGWAVYVLCPRLG